MSADPYNLQRFADAQDRVYDDVLAELAQGRKTSHWMWFVFPQLQGLGHSATARYYGIASREEAAAYLGHPVLGPRLRECVDRLLALDGADPHAIFGSPDDLKLRSCLTLFSAVAPDEARFGEALRRYYPEGPDEATLRLLRA
ncbi:MULTISPECIES: DUF1810 domain-containing protein [unclassified Achromobacter]|jgi:uncharacterized protein (DUF1810 family)|uniref:DUF1810 domain-containing protein n=1 Tax=unclassified Achromobacter TaxID=2626865 RepID=UPI00069E5D7B|nr:MULTISPECIES: DUF1810 domain-containing protein [unclassified Achromobacter]KOF55503.1 calpastatin [Achromobacter sp. DMS1]